MKKSFLNYKLWLYVLLIVHVIRQLYTNSSELKAVNELHFIGICVWIFVCVYADKKPSQFNFNQKITVPENSDVTATNNEEENAY